MVQKRKKNFSFKGKVADNAMSQKKAASSYGYLSLPKDVKMYSPEVRGKSVFFDIIPYKVTDTKHPDKNVDKGTALVGDPWWKRTFKIHRGVGATNDTAVCLTSIGKKCPVCEFKAKRAKEGAEKDELDTMKASERALYLVRPKKSKKYEDEIHIFDISVKLFQDLLAQELDENPDQEVFPSMDEGKTLKVRFEDKTIPGSQPFAVAERIDFDERDEQYDWDDLEASPNLDEILIILSYDELHAKFFDEDESTSTGHLDEDEEDDDEEDDDEDEDEEDEAPVRKKKPIRSTPSTKKRKPPKDEDEEEDDEEDDEEEKPKKKKVCPEGYKFGIDTEKYDECADCPIWDECLEAKRKKR